MSKEKRPKVGDFVLWLDCTWVIKKILKQEMDEDLVTIEAISSSPKKGILWGDRDEILIDSLAPTKIQTWEVE